MRVATLEPQPYRSVDGTRYNREWRHGGWVSYWLDVKYLSYKDFDFTTNLDAFPQKALFLGTDGTTDVGYEYQLEHQSKAYPNSVVKLITGAGHISMYFEENVGQAISHIRQYLDESGMNGGGM